MRGIEDIYLLKPEKRLEYLLNKYGPDKIKFESLFVDENIHLTPAQYTKYGKDMPLEILVAAATNNFDAYEGSKLLLKTSSIDELLSKLDVLPDEYFDNIRMNFFHVDYIDNYIRKVTEDQLFRVYLSKDPEDIRKLFTYFKMDYLVKIILHDIKGKRDPKMMLYDLAHYLYDNDLFYETIVFFNLLSNKYYDNEVILNNAKHLTAVLHPYMTLKMENDRNTKVYEFNYILEKMGGNSETIASHFFPIYRILFLPLYRLYPERFLYKSQSVSTYYLKTRRRRYRKYKKSQMIRNLKRKVGL